MKEIPKHTLEKKILDLLDKHWQTMAAVYKICLTKFEQQEYVIQQICEQLDIDKEELFNKGKDIAEKNVEKKLEEVIDRQELFEQIDELLKEEGNEK